MIVCVCGWVCVVVCVVVSVRVRACVRVRVCVCGLVCAGYEAQEVKPDGAWQNVAVSG